LSNLNTSFLWSFKQQIYENIGINLEYYDLDNAATIFGLNNSYSNPGLFRISCTLIEKIKPDYLQLAANNIIYRFPYFQVNLKPGIFWPFWETNLNSLIVEVDSEYPCQKIPLYKNGIYPFRILYKNRRIAVEFHHSITDGTGALTFLRALVAEYLKFQGIISKEKEDLFHLEQTPHPEESIDANKQIFRKFIPFPKKLSKAFRVPLKSENKGIYHITTSIIAVDEVLKIARKFKVTINDLLTALYIETLQDILYDMSPSLHNRWKKPIRIAVPINLRNIYPSKTMRNFSYMVPAEIDPRLGRHSFDEILKLVHHSIRTQIVEKLVNQQISRNVKLETNILMQSIPLPTKMIAARIGYSMFGEKVFSGKNSNLGIVSMPKILENYIDNFQFVLSPSRAINSGCAFVSFKENLYINFGRTTKNPIIVDTFNTKLEKLGVYLDIKPYK